MIKWFKNLDAREANALLLGGLAVLAMAVYQLIWVPLDQGQAQTAAALERRSAYVEEVRQLAGHLEAVRSLQDGHSVSGAGQSLLSVVDKSSKSFQLAKQVKRIEPDGQASVRVWLEDAPFDTMIRWLHGLLSQYAVSVDNISVDPGKAPGMIKARLILIR